MPVSQSYYSKACTVCLHPCAGALGHSAIRTLKMQRHTSSQATYPATSTKSQSFLSTWPLAFPCTVMWNTQFKLLFTKLKTQSKMSWCWLCVFLPQELVGHFRKQRSSFHRGKLIHIINYDPWLCFNTADCPAIKRKGSTRPGKEAFANV